MAKKKETAPAPTIDTTIELVENAIKIARGVYSTKSRNELYSAITALELSLMDLKRSKK